MNPLRFVEPIDLETASVGELIRAYRIADRNDGMQGTPQADLAEHLGISQAHLSQIETGRKRIANELDLAKYCRELDLPPQEAERLLARWKSESTSALTRRIDRLERLSPSKDEVVPGIPLRALRVLLETNPTAKSALLGWLAEMPARRHRVTRTKNDPRRAKPKEKKGKGGR